MLFWLKTRTQSVFVCGLNFKNKKRQSVVRMGLPSSSFFTWWFHSRVASPSLPFCLTIVSSAIVGFQPLGLQLAHRNQMKVVHQMKTAKNVNYRYSE